MDWDDAAPADLKQRAEVAVDVRVTEITVLCL